MEEKHYGYIRINLEDLLAEKGLSKNKLSHRAELQRTQLNNYCRGKVTRLDTAVLARICCSLDCQIQDLLEYVPEEDGTSEKAPEAGDK
ncbi:MAG: helix-turn-helix transcriptional regulator [Clostridiales bacterium]|nr:helix-turn-helix transcriptional regulator [Clostridiales bacterium]